MKCGAIFLAVLGGLALPYNSPLDAQTVRGTVVDSATARALSGFTAELVDSVDKVVAHSVGDDSGRFVVTAPDSGDFSLRLQRIGYRTAMSGVLSLGKGAEMTVAVRLPALPVQLPPVRVTANATEARLQNIGFFRRKSEGVGHFLDPQTVEQYVPKAKLATDILVHIPGVRMVRNSSGVPVPQLRGCQTLREGTNNGPQIYIDGMNTGQDAFAVLTPGDILAAEVYIGPGEVPLQYGGTDAPCGVIIIWTKR